MESGYTSPVRKQGQRVQYDHCGSHAATVLRVGNIGLGVEKMYLYYQLWREDLYRHYHARSLAEPTFSMVKAKFRDHVRSTSDVAMKNEVLCKFLCHTFA
jgi:hypothetical protein